MDIRPSSRFMNAFQRFRNSASNNNTMSQKSALYHQNTTNSVGPAEIASTMKPSSYKRSLADKIKSKFHQQLAKKKNKASLVELSAQEGTISMPRSASLGSTTQWSSRLSVADSKSTPLKKGFHANHHHGGKLKLSHSASVSSCLSISSSSSASSSLFIVPPSIATSRPALSSAFSLTKSISSHRLYNKSSSSSSSEAAGSNRHNLQATRPISTVIHPTHSARLVMPPSSPTTTTMMTSSSSRRGSLQPQRHHALVRFTKLVSVRETFCKTDYDRGSDPEAVCTRLTPAIAHQIKEELNAYKLHEMKVHELSRVHTHFFL